MSVLDELAEALLKAAEQLQRSSNPYARAWGDHLLVDRGAILLIAVTWREPSVEGVPVAAHQPSGERITHVSS